MTGQEQAVWFRDTYDAIRMEIGKAIVGQDDIVEGVLLGMVANSHILLEGLPGLGKTMLVRALSETLSLSFSRIQFTPDLMPADVTGTNVLAQSDGGARSFEFKKGPIFANLILADEINRATPKTQSAMLEAMQERSVTVGGRRHILEEPFLVMATQNPIEQEGTYPLPEAQLDRFFLKLLVPFPTKDELAEIVNRTTGVVTSHLSAVSDKEAVLKMREIAREVTVAPHVLDYALRIIIACHPESPEASSATKKYVRYGPSPRGAQSIITAGKIHALLDGRFNVAKEDIKKASNPALRHRVLLNFEAEADGMTPDSVIDQIMEQVEAGDKDPVRV